MTGRSWLPRIDFGLVAVVSLLSGIGMAVLWSASHGPEGLVAEHSARQLQWMGLGLCIMLGAMWVDYRHIQTYAVPIYLVHLVLLGLVLFIGVSGGGAQRWLSVGPVRIQPSEFMKIATVIAVAYFLCREVRHPPYSLRQLVLPGAVIAIPAGLILLEPDLGTAVLVTAVGLSVVLFQGVRKKILLWCGVLLLAAAPVAWGFLHDYQRKRILTFLEPERDPLGAGYHIIQSKIAVGSGQLFGKGFLQGTQVHLQFLPERHTDFIFAVLSEEWGFLGSAGVLALYCFLVLWGLDIAAKAKDPFGRLLAVGLTSILFFHVVVNVGMATGMLPVVGVPLPLFSYGGSSVVTTFLITGILLSIRFHRFARSR